MSLIDLFSCSPKLRSISCNENSNAVRAAKLVVEGALFHLISYEPYVVLDSTFVSFCVYFEILELSEKNGYLR
jgi:hypothetical protein